MTLTQITASAAWDFAGSGNWGDITKWSPMGTYPNGAGQTATFGSLVSSPASITITNDINPTLGTLTFANTAVSYTLSGGTVTMNNNNTGGRRSTSTPAATSSLQPVAGRHRRHHVHRGQQLLAERQWRHHQ